MNINVCGPMDEYRGIDHFQEEAISDTDSM